MFPPSETLSKYLALEAVVTLLDEDDADDEPLVVHMLSQMDDLWFKMTDDEREYLNNRPPAMLTTEAEM